jgi:hypothetical protein
MEAMFRGDMKSRAEFYQAAIEAPWMWPSEVRVKEGMNPDSELDDLAEKRYRPGDPKDSKTKKTAPPPNRQPPPDDVDDEEEDNEGARARGRGGRTRSIRAALKGTLAVHDNAVRCLRRERVGVEKLAKKHSDDVPGWQASLREFYSDFAGFVAETMRLDIRTARGFAAQHGLELAARGVVVFEDPHWERFEADELTALALNAGGQAA